MSYRRLYVFVEGTDDERFFERLVKPRLEESYDQIDIVQYAQDTHRKLRSFLLSVRMIEGADIIWVCDNDVARCVSERKQQVRKCLPAIGNTPIVVVVMKIESWYLAGVDAQGSHGLGIKNQARADDITKEKFSKIRPKRVKSNREFMLAILDLFCIETAQQKNRSFRYFCQKFLRLDSVVFRVRCDTFNLGPSE